MSLTFSDAEEIQFPKFYNESFALLVKQQRKSKNSNRTKHLHQKIANKRADHHHKLTTELAKKFQKIYWSADNFKNLSKKFGKQYSELALGKFRDILTNKLASRIDGLGELISVTNKYSTQTCSGCGSRSGPRGWDGLEVRDWTCSKCGAAHDRDVNAAINTLVSGQGMSAEQGKSVNRKHNHNSHLHAGRVLASCA